MLGLSRRARVIEGAFEFVKVGGFAISNFLCNFGVTYVLYVVAR